MFTGIIQEIGRVAGVRKTGGGVQLSVEAPVSTPALRVGDSVAINGVCQTVIAKEAGVFHVEAVEETLRKTTLGMMRPSATVNLELPLRLSDRLGGHLVLGHVDCTGSVVSITTQSSSRLIEVAFPPEFARWLIPVGSIGVDGISLTVASLREASFTLSIIPHTLERTTLASVVVGGLVNLEFDLIGKYVESLLLKKGAPPAGVTWEQLKGWGYGA